MRKLLLAVLVAGLILTGVVGCSSGKSSRAAQRGVSAAAAARIAPPSTAPAAPSSRPAVGDSSGTYMIVGTMIAEANGTPIYADKVLNDTLVSAALQAKAHSLEPAQFRIFARDTIQAKVEEEIGNELEFAAAQRNTTEEEQQIASSLTTQWRQKQIIQSGGSEAVARWNSMNPADGSLGVDFDEKVQKQYRWYLIMIYYQRRVWPRVQVSADDIRRYYERNLEQVFTEKPGIRFRVIHIGTKQTGTQAEAKAKAQSIHEKAVRGDDFATLAATHNDNRTWRANRGYMEMADQKDADGNVLKNDKGEVIRQGMHFERGALKLADLEESLFTIEPGAVTPVFEDRDGFYFAKLEDRKTGQVRPFEDETVQSEIRRLLESQQRTELRNKERDKLRRSAVVRSEPAMLEPAIEMAMQKYAQWRQDNATADNGG